ncbi:MAG: hypothetical protein JXB05_14825 [Myxococcaceae bacterium]|nr:hypothetical protein [Myxococcaceae bacterium]
MAEFPNMYPVMQPYPQMPQGWPTYPPQYQVMGGPVMGTRGAGPQQQQLSPSEFGNIPGGFQPQMPFQGAQQGMLGQQQGVPGMQPSELGNVPGGFQAQLPFQGFQQGVPGMQQGLRQQGVSLSEADKAALKPVLHILKEGRSLLAAGQLSPIHTHRLLAAYAYLSGFLESRGVIEVGTFTRTIPQPEISGAPTENEQFDQLLYSIEALVSGTETRVPPLVVAVGASVAGSAIWEGIKWGYGKIRR